jgi:hypothetical protein
LPTFAFFDHKENRPTPESDALHAAGFEILNETAYVGIEALLGAEVPVARQWAFLESLRDSGTPLKAGVPVAFPGDDVVRDLTTRSLKDAKGWGRAAELIELCSGDELPTSLTGFLERIYERFPRPKVTAASISAESAISGSTDPVD